MKMVKKNQKLHNPDSPLLIGEVKDGDVVKEVNEPSFMGAQTLLKMDKLIKQKIAEGNTHIPEPNFLAVITGDPIAKVRKDGVMVIPIGALR